MEFRKNKETREKFDKFINNVAIKYNVPIEALSDVKFQSIENAGAEEGENLKAAKEWKEKGTDSSYFKKWSGDTPVVKADNANSYEFKTGEGVTVECYHASYNDFNSFDKNKIGEHTGNYGFNGFGFNFSTNKNRVEFYGDKTKHVYVNIKNPFIPTIDNLNEYIDLFEPSRVEKAEGYEQKNLLPFLLEYGENKELAEKFTNKLIEDGYDGVINGDEIVVFNPEQIKSVDNRGTFDSNNPNIYYQSARTNVVDWTDKFVKVPTFEEIEKHIKDIIASGEVFDTLSPEWKIDIKGGNRVVDKITNAGNFQKLKMSPKKRHNKYVSGIKELINNSIYSHSDKNDKPKEKPSVLKYHYFDVNVKIGDKSYWVRLECEENKNAPKGGYTNRSKNSSRSNNNVNQASEDVKTVHLYNIKEMKANKALYQSTKEGSGTVDNNDVLGDYLIAGYNLSEITDKLSELYENVNKADIEGNRELSDKFLAKAHILEDAIDVVVGDKKFNNANEKTDIALRAYYVMNNQEIPKSYEEADKKSLYYFTNLQAGCFYNKLFKVEVIMR